MHWSQRRIALELGIDRETVRKCLACGLEGAKPAISPPGSLESKPATFAGVPARAAQGIGPIGCTGIGTKLAGLGGLLAAPLAASVKIFAGFADKMAEVRSVTGASTADAAVLALEETNEVQLVTLEGEIVGGDFQLWFRPKDADPD